MRNQGLIRGTTRTDWSTIPSIELKSPVTNSPLHTRKEVKKKKKGKRNRKWHQLRVWCRLPGIFWHLITTSTPLLLSPMTCLAFPLRFVLLPMIFSWILLPLKVFSQFFVSYLLSVAVFLTLICDDFDICSDFPLLSISLTLFKVTH